MKIILTLLLLTSVCFSYSQEKRELNWQDFKNSVQNTDVVKPVKWGTLTVFHIKDINKFLYKVTIAGRAFELLTPMPSELQVLFRQTPAELQKNVENKKAAQAVNEAESGTAKVNNFHRAMGADRAEHSVTTPEPLETALKELKTSFEEYLAAARQVSKDILSLKRSRNQLITIAQKDASYITVTNEVNGVQWPIPNVESNYTDLKEKYDATLVKLEAAKVLAEDNEEHISNIASIEKNIKTAESLIDQEALLTLIDDINYLHTELNNESNFTVVAPPVQMDGDLVSYEVSITPTVTRTYAPFRNPMKFTFDVPAKGGLKVDFSVGPAVSLGSNAKDEKYYLAETSSTDSVSLKSRENKNIITPTIGAFMHIYGRSARWAALGAMLGVGVGFQNTTELNANLFVGATLVMGKQQKVMASLGASFLRVERLTTDQFVDGNKYATSKINVDQVTEKVFKSSVFFSISYNLTSRTEISR